MERISRACSGCCSVMLFRPLPSFPRVRGLVAFYPAIDAALIVFPARARVGGGFVFQGTHWLGISRACAGWWVSEAFYVKKLWYFPRVRGLSAVIKTDVIMIVVFPARARVVGIRHVSMDRMRRISRACAGWWPKPPWLIGFQRSFPCVRGLVKMNIF